MARTGTLLQRACHVTPSPLLPKGSSVSRDRCLFAQAAILDEGNNRTDLVYRYKRMCLEFSRVLNVVIKPKFARRCFASLCGDAGRRVELCEGRRDRRDSARLQAELPD